MTEAEKANLAAEAQRLKDNEAFQYGLSAMRSEALERLVAANPTDTEIIRTNQAVVHVIDEFRSKVETMIRQGRPRDPAGIV